ncbi:MAG TPA: hypothetical protein VNI77_11080 [Nitrososphaera sp.]|nr:hypothetical protein [Nitrososphaera sp.]
MAEINQAPARWRDSSACRILCNSPEQRPRQSESPRIGRIEEEELVRLIHLCEEEEKDEEKEEMNREFKPHLSNVIQYARRHFWSQKGHPPLVVDHAPHRATRLGT